MKRWFKHYIMDGNCNPVQAVAIVAAIWIGGFGIVHAIEWRDTDDEFKTQLETPGMDNYRLWQFKDVMADRRQAEQLERIADQLVLMNTKLDTQAQLNVAIQAMFATTISTNSAAFREMVKAVEAIAAQP